MLDEVLAGEDAWDPSVYVFPGIDKRTLFAGVMARRLGETNAYWPEDHWSRRTGAFDWEGDRWILRDRSVFGPWPKKETWLGHNYGHDFIGGDDGSTWMFSEKVSEEKNGQPYKTEIFARRISSQGNLYGKELDILKIPKHPWPASQRKGGTLLIEGPRPFKVGEKYLISFSAGDYFSDDYGIHLAWANMMTGPYTPYLDKNGDLKKFAKAIDKKMPMTWGPARAAFFKVDNNWWMLFHGIEASPHHDLSEDKRNVYLTPVEIDDAHGLLDF